MGELLDDAIRGVGKRFSLGAIASATIVILVAASRAVGFGAAGRLILFLASVVALAGGLFQCVNTASRPFLGHWEAAIRGRWLLSFEAVLGLLLVAGGLYGTLADAPRAWLLTLIYAVPTAFYWQIEADIARRVVDGGKRLGTSHVMGFRPFKTTSLAESARIAEKTPQGGLFVKLFGPLPPHAPQAGASIAPTFYDWAHEEESDGVSEACDPGFAGPDGREEPLAEATRPESVPAADNTGKASRATGQVAISAARIWIAFALAAVFLACLATTTGLAAQSVVHRYLGSRGRTGGATKPNRPNAPTKSTPPTTTVTTPPRTPPPTKSGTPTGPPAQQGYWTEVCKTLPALGGPAWAKQALYDFYLGRNGAGAFQGGCTGRVVVVSEGFVYEVGRDPATGAFRSVAVASQRFPDAIFLSPLAGRVLDLIDTYGSVGGSLRHDVVNGDYQLAYVPTGTVVFTRETKIDFSGDATPYVELPPAVADDWVAAMQAKGWLWPELVGSAGGVEIFRFVASPITERVVERVRYDEASGRALRLVAGAWAANIADGRQIPDSTVQSLALGAR